MKYAIGSCRDVFVCRFGEGGENKEYRVTLKMTVRPYPATGPSYASGGEPPEPAEFEVVDIHPDPLDRDLRDQIEEQAIEEANPDDWIWEREE